MNSQPALSTSLSEPGSPSRLRGLWQEHQRRQAQRSLIRFTEWTFRRYRTAAHHRIIADELEGVERGEIDRLMLLVAPRHGKSELASRRFPGFYLGKHPDRQFISASASSDFAGDFGREVRNLIQGEEYRALFSTRLSEDSQARNKWHTTEGGVYYAVGIGGQIMGRGADVLLIDDPFATMADAQSEAGRKAVWDWYTGTAYNRLQPGGAIVVINHRMHEDDLCGRLLAQQGAGGDKWRVVEMPAIDDDGAALWPEAYPIEALKRIRANTIPRYWSALYQQKPTPDEGDYFKADWLKSVEVLPAKESLHIYGASDYAVTSKGGDYTVHLVVGIDADNRMYVLDLWRGQSDSATWIEAWCDLVKLWKPREWAEEGGQINAAVGPFLERRARERQAYTYRRQFPSRHDKSVRAQSIRARMATIGLYLPKSAEWRADFESELLRFPAAKHDDQVDALGLIGNLLDHIRQPSKPKTEEAQNPSGYSAVKKPSTRVSVATL